jgi:broad specificity phosphatase PhoE
MRLLLVRHAAHDLAGRALAGRMPGLTINEQGCMQAQALASWLAAEDIAAVHSSPQPRARDTVAPLAARLKMPVSIAPEFDEIDFGHWTGRSFDQVRDQDPVVWDQWVNRRSTATPPGGEAFIDVQRRALHGIERLRRSHSEQTVLVASHGDVIKAVLAGVLGLSLDNLERFDIGCASLSVLHAGDGWTQVERINQPLSS